MWNYFSPPDEYNNNIHELKKQKFESCFHGSRELTLKRDQTSKSKSCGFRFRLDV